MTRDELAASTVACGGLDFDDPVSALVSCHRKIERQLARAREGARLLIEGDPADRVSALAALDAVKSHFGGPADKHTQDEELSLLPRMWRYETDLDTRVVDALEVLVVQHRFAADLHDAYRYLSAAAGSAGGGSRVAGRRVATLLDELVALYSEHIGLEEEIVYPAAAVVLSAGDVMGIAAEMRHRRDRSDPSSPRPGPYRFPCPT